MKFLLIIFLFQNMLIAEQTFSQMYNEPVDDTHKFISDNAVEFSDYIDKSVNKLFSKEAQEIEQIPKNDLENEIVQMDTFFRNAKYFEDTEDTYLKVHTEFLFQSKADESSNITVRARIPLSRSHKNFKLFIEDVDGNNSAPGVGIDYFAAKTYSIDSRYSIGASGFAPYIRARYKTTFEMGEWVIEPIQAFKYSIKTQFEEETSLYFDTKFKDHSLFRVQLHRRTAQETSGMNYGLNVSYFTIKKDKLGFNLTQSFSGNTQYQDIKPYGFETFAGINNYTTSLNFRRSVWKKWIFYEITPAVNFHRQYDYQENYSLRFAVDLYFGRFTGN